LLAVFDVDGEKILTADREQPFHHDAAVATGQSGIGDDCKRLSDQRRQAEIATERR
jgi:hypothetical protein